MARKKDSAGERNWKDVIGENPDFLRPLVQQVIQQVLESDMEEALGAPRRASARRAEQATGLVITGGHW